MGLFFFQAEDGIRDYKVTGVQTCALPISGSSMLETHGCDGLCALRSAGGWIDPMRPSRTFESSQPEETVMKTSYLPLIAALTLGVSLPALAGPDFQAIEKARAARQAAGAD